ncbi:hypothetical protein ARMGADRAFT_423667 [Armillaria gallica]|uniref:Uncharacterized protein n=1 Tax=Armillaria gallica TaxID=47427 RepID=A0A2H3ERB9_ARMGA|nr:hypothetical protein ARMGADRAFT_423667 [Armillaria gallica]
MATLCGHNTEYADADIYRYCPNAISCANQPSPTSSGLRDDFAAIPDSMAPPWRLTTAVDFGKRKKTGNDAETRRKKTLGREWEWGRVRSG